MNDCAIEISIVIPTWNRPDSLRRLVQLISLEDNAGDLEVVIVDDCSEQRNWELVQNIRDSFNHVRLYRNSSNIGMTRNWNKAVKYARGRWIGLMSDDDIFKPDSIKRIREYVAFVSKPCLILQNGFIKVDHEWLEPGVVAANRVGLPPASGQFWHREITEQLGGYDERIKYCPDAEFWLRIAYNYPVLLIRNYLVIPCQHNTNYMWEIFRKPDFIEQVTLSLRLSSYWLLGESASDESQVQYQIDDGMWETMRTVLNNTFLKPGKMKNFSKYFYEFVRHSILLNRKRLMIMTIVNLPVLRAKDCVRLITGKSRQVLM
jgi:glycosyltransferase involved in cell wall biosynthesis